MRTVNQTQTFLSIIRIFEGSIGLNSVFTGYFFVSAFKSPQESCLFFGVVLFHGYLLVFVVFNASFESYLRHLLVIQTGIN